MSFDPNLSFAYWQIVLVAKLASTEIADCRISEQLTNSSERVSLSVTEGELWHFGVTSYRNAQQTPLFYINHAMLRKYWLHALQSD